MSTGTSTKCMLTMMNQNKKPTQNTVQQDGKKKPNAATKPVVTKGSALKQQINESNIDQPVNEMNKLLDMCLSPQNQKNKPKPTSI